MLAVVLGIGAGWVAVVEAFASELGPWVASPAATPEEIEERWNAVLRLRGAPEAREGDARLLKALKKQEAAPKRPCCNEAVRLSSNELVPEEQAALELLVDWYRLGGKVVRPLCMSMGQGEVEEARDAIAVASLRLGYLALASARGEGDIERVLAVWHLAEGLRRNGTVIGMAVGYALRPRVVGWFADNSMALPPEVDARGATLEELYTSLAWQAWCADEWTRYPELSYGKPRSEGEAEGPSVVPVIGSRERQLRRYYVGKVLAPPMRKVAELKRREAEVREELPLTTQLLTDARRGIQDAHQGTEELEEMLVRLSEDGAISQSAD